MMIKNLNHLGVMLAVAVGTLVAGGLLLLMLLVGVEPAGAAFPGQNGEIVFSSQRAGGHFDSPYEIYTINSTGTGETDRLTNNTGNDRAPAWSPDTGPLKGGNKIAFMSDRDGDYDIYTMNPTLSIEGPNGLIFVPTNRLTNNSAWDVWSAWSPDGKKIAFTSNRDDGQLTSTGECVDSGLCNWNIYTMNSDGTDVDRLTADPAPDYQPAWSPDGKKIAFASNRPGAGGIYTMNSDGTDVDPLTHNPGDIEPDWSPGGRKIAFTRQRGSGPPWTRSKDIYTKNADGTGSESCLTCISGSGWNFQPAWSPDGKKIAFVSNREGGYDIYTMNSDGTGVDPLTNDVDRDLEPDWQPLRHDSGVCLPPTCH